jgi:hypothetical protein
MQQQSRNVFNEMNQTVGRIDMKSVLEVRDKNEGLNKS